MITRPDDLTRPNSMQLATSVTTTSDALWSVKWPVESRGVGSGDVCDHDLRHKQHLLATPPEVTHEVTKYVLSSVSQDVTTLRQSLYKLGMLNEVRIFELRKKYSNSFLTLRSSTSKYRLV